jgi:EmrB/QacA subfamily drug resistance transporter
MTHADSTALSPAVGTEAPEPSRRLGIAFAVICGGFALSYLDMMIVNVAFPAIERGFRGSSTADLSWALNGYAIVFAALLVPFGRLSDRSSKKTGFLLGLSTFTLASALCGAAQDVPMLVGARILQAAGAAALVPTSLGLLLAAYPPDRRAWAIRTMTAIGGFGVALAPIIGGLLTSVNWRWIFFINAPIGLACVLAGRKVLPDSEAGERGPLPDLLGSLLLILGVGLLALGIVNAPGWGWTSVRVIASLIGAAAFITLFYYRSARHPSPVISFDLLRIRGFATANVVSFLFSTSFSAMLLSYMLWSQTVWGYSALKTGLAYAPGTFLMPLVAASSGRLIKRLGAPAVIALGVGLMTAGVIWWAVTAQVRPDYPAMLLPGAVLTPVGSVLALVTVIAVVTKDLPPTAFATGSAINSMVRQVAFVVGISVFVATLGTAHSGHALVAAFQRGWIITAAVGAAAALSSLLLLGGGITSPGRR